MLEDGIGVCAVHDPKQREAPGTGPLRQHLPLWCAAVLCYCLSACVGNQAVTDHYNKCSACLKQLQSSS